MNNNTYIVKVSKKNQINILVKVRRKFNVKDKVIIRVEDNEIKIIPVIPLKSIKLLRNREIS